jgi:hypothetical protein
LWWGLPIDDSTPGNRKWGRMVCRVIETGQKFAGSGSGMAGDGGGGKETGGGEEESGEGDRCGRGFSFR